jgi:hypothetical protein
MKILVAALASLALVAAAAAATAPRELPQSPDWQQGKFRPLLPGTTYVGSHVSPTPTIRAADNGWVGTQIVTHQLGKIRYESAAFLGHQGEIDLVTGPAMTKSPQEAIDWTWNRRFDRPFGPLKTWKLAGRQAIAFDGTNTGNVEFTLIGGNPPEVQIDRGQSFRLAAFSVHGRTVVLAVRAAHLATFLPIATRLLSSLRFPD